MIVLGDMELSQQIVAIHDENVALDYIRSALDGAYNDEIIQLEFTDWPKFEITIRGDRYNSTLTTTLMKALVELQSHLNRIYAEVIYGKSAKALTNEEREALEIVYKVEQGSSQVVADLAGFFTELGKNAMEKMTGKQVVTTVLGVAALFTASSGYNSYLTNGAKSVEEQNRHEITLRLVEQQPKLLQIQSDHQATYTNILKSVADAEEVELNQTVMSQAQIEEITRSERQQTELKRLDAEYLISSLKVKNDRYRIEITRTSDDHTFATDLFKGHLNMTEMDTIMKAFTSEIPIRLNVVGRVKGDAISIANIVGINNEANGQQVASNTGTQESNEI